MTPDQSKRTGEHPPLQPPPRLPLLYSTKEAARLLNVSHRTLEDWRHRGCGPRFITINRMVRYRADDLAAFLDRPSYANTGQANAA
jgi:excisionase family DNA binding protein